MLPVESGEAAFANGRCILGVVLLGRHLPEEESTVVELITG